jgi:hypothetical protein
VLPRGGGGLAGLFEPDRWYCIDQHLRLNAPGGRARLPFGALTDSDNWAAKSLNSPYAMPILSVIVSHYLPVPPAP